jgi:spore photoproduct lyase
MSPAEYRAKFLLDKQHTLFDRLDSVSQAAIQEIAAAHRLTRQELKRVVDAALDLRMWRETDLITRWREWHRASVLQGREFKKWALRRLDDDLAGLRGAVVRYAAQPPRQSRQQSRKITLDQRPPESKIFGMCPVQSDKTLCCNLRTIDAVKNCGFGCSYCSIQTLYAGTGISFDPEFRQKLDAIRLDPDRHYHIGTGQSSDALMWGNRHNILADLLDFARKWPKVLLEFKTKSKNVGYLLQADVPRNVVCSWSLNPERIIRNEEHLTADLDARLAAARAVADKNIRVGFHLHPMIHYQGWERDYGDLIARILDTFHPEEVVFISFGALTFPKPVLTKLRTYGIQTKIHQTVLTANPEGKRTYPDPIKEKLFRHAYAAFAPWHGRVFFYLCMEEARFWDSAFGYRYPDNTAMEAALLQSAWNKLPATA